MAVATGPRAALLAGAVALCACLVTSPITQAAPAPAPSGHWCPGDQWDPGWGDVYNWNWGQCHDWQGLAAGSGPTGSGPWGPPPPWAAARPLPPPWAPGAQLMWHPTNQGWGFWNNGIWTPV